MSKQYPGGIISKTAPVPSGPYADSTAPGIWTLEQQAAYAKLGQWPTAGNTPPSAFIENLFSTYLWTGNDATQTITNGINLSANGGLVWIKSRNATYSYILSDTVRGTGKFLSSNTTDAQGTDANDVTAFNTTGFTVGNNARINNPSFRYVGWTFREQAKFFDIVTYTGNGSTQNIAHNLGSAPGCIIVKCTSNAGQDWFVYHRTQGNGYGLLNTTDSWGTYTGYWNDTAPTSTQFSVGTSNGVNGNGFTYVAYLFAHDAGGFGASGTDNVISCGSFSTSGGAATVTLGYEPQWILWKRTDSAQNWNVYDNMRGWAQQQVAQIYPNLTQVEDIYTGSEYFFPTSTGFQLNSSFGLSGTYVYVTIRRGPMAVPTVGTSVYIPDAGTNGTNGGIVPIGFPVDMSMTAYRSSGAVAVVNDRVRGYGNANSAGVTPAIQTGNSDSEAGYAGSNPWFYNAWNTTITRGSNGANPGGAGIITWFMRRAPSFFDVVCYTGTGAVRTISHNLGVAPELMISKTRDTSNPWQVWTKYFSYLSGTAASDNCTGVLNSTNAFDGYSESSSINALPTASVFSLGTQSVWNGNTKTAVMYLFATCPGVSKVGSYTGTGAAQTINCGFTTGSRLVLIKRADSTGDWFIWDSARGIIPSNDPYLQLNLQSTAEVTGTDYVDTTSVGFDITSTAPAAINANGGTFIFLAIA